MFSSPPSAPSLVTTIALSMAFGSFAVLYEAMESHKR
jgi:hypothetical protein